jgi:enoyl-CoA hydratase/carnithine racemase
MAFFKFATTFLLYTFHTQLWHGFVGAQVLKQSCINHDCSALRVTLSNPPVNLWDVNVISAFNAFMHSLNKQNDTKVVVFCSDTSDFWAAPIDLNILSSNPTPGLNVSAIFETYYANLDLLLTTPVVFIGEVNGRAWGAGDEHLLRMDMRFAGPEAQFGAPEAAVGLIHVGGLQQLTRLIGPGRTAEYMLAAAQVSASEAARVGWVNSVHRSAEALRKHVDDLAVGIALFRPEMIRATKASIAEQAPSKTAFDNDLLRFNKLAALPFVQQNVDTILRLSQNQSRSWEEDNNDNIVRQLY